MNSRRDFFRLTGRTAFGGGAVLLAACGDEEDESELPPGVSPAERDVRLLNSALDLENTSIAAYTAGARLLSGEALKAARLVVEQEREHAAGLSRAIGDVGGTPNRPRRGDEYLRQFPNLETADDALRFGVDLENTVVEAYLDSLPKLSTPDLRQTAAAIVANEAEHISVLLGLLNPGDTEGQVPDAFVTGIASVS